TLWDNRPAPKITPVSPKSDTSIDVVSLNGDHICLLAASKILSRTDGNLSIVDPVKIILSGLFKQTLLLIVIAAYVIALSILCTAHFRFSSAAKIISSKSCTSACFDASLISKPSAIYVCKQSNLPQVHIIPLGLTTVCPFSPAGF